MKANCPFCLEAADSAYYRRAVDRAWPWTNRILCQNKGAIAVPTIGPLIYPTALVISRAHHVSFLAADPTTRRAILDLVHQLAASRQFGSGREKAHEVLILEHGGTSSDDPSCQCIDHCHLFVLPGMQLVIEQFRQDGPTQPLALDAHGKLEEKPYLFAGIYNPNNQTLGRQILGHIDRQDPRRRRYFRHLVASLLGLAGHGSDWRRGMNPEWMVALYRNFLSPRPIADH